MTNVLAVRMPRVFVRMLALAGLSLAAVAADVSVAAAQPGEGMEAIQRLFSDPALQNYRLTSANLDKFIRATDAISALDGDEFDIEEHVDMDNPENVQLGEIAAAMDSDPRLKGAINGAGMTSHEYVTFAFSTMQAMFASMMVQMSGEQALASMPGSTLKENIQFFTQNQARFEALRDDN
jgi:hypothetical protein